jgi:peptidoglycan/LPS O-acetylase OafA/YrhL
VDSSASAPRHGSPGEACVLNPSRRRDRILQETHGKVIVLGAFFLACVHGGKQMADEVSAAPPKARFWWLDGIKGVSILWIVFFHFFSTFDSGYPWVLDPKFLPTVIARCTQGSILTALGVIVKSLFIAVTNLAFHSVGVFLVASGFGLTYSLAKTGGPRAGWGDWYFQRVVRLFPMYWVAHLVFLISPFVFRPEPIDYRFLLSFLGDRVYPIESLFFYFNPALWYFGLLLQLYLVFPILFRLLQTLGAGRFLIVCGAVTLITRYLLLGVIPVHGFYLQGGFFGSRLWEFVFGMVLGLFARQQPIALEKALFAKVTLVGAIIAYGLGLACYAIPGAYIFTDPLTSASLFIILAHLPIWSPMLRRLASVVTYVGLYSYGLYLLHQPYVLYFGTHMRNLGMLSFVLLAWVIIALLTVGAMFLERGVNHLTDRVLKRGKLSLAMGTPVPVNRTKQ